MRTLMANKNLDSVPRSRRCVTAWTRHAQQCRDAAIRAAQEAANQARTPPVPPTAVMRTTNPGVASAALAVGALVGFLPGTPLNA